MKHYPKKLGEWIEGAAKLDDHKQMNPSKFTSHLNKEHPDEIKMYSDGKLSKLPAHLVYYYHPVSDYGNRQIERIKEFKTNDFSENTKTIIAQAEKDYEERFLNIIKKPERPPEMEDLLMEAKANAKYARELLKYAHILEKSKKRGNSEAASAAYFNEERICNLLTEAKTNYQQLDQTLQKPKDKIQAFLEFAYIQNQVRDIGKPKKEKKGRTTIRYVEKIVEKPVEKRVEVPVEKIVEKSVEKIIFVTQSVPIKAEELEKMSREDKLLAEYGAYGAAILRNMDRHDTWGGKHIPEEEVVRNSLPKEKRGEVKEILSYFKNKGYLMAKGSCGEKHISLNPVMKKEIEEFIGNFIKEDDNSNH